MEHLQVNCNNLSKKLQDRQLQVIIGKSTYAYKNLGCSMSLKIHLHSFRFPSQNCGAVSDEHSEWFYQGTAAMEKRYQGKWKSSMLVDYCCTITIDAPDIEKRQYYNC